MAIACLIFDSIFFKEENIYKSYHLTMHRQACSAISIRGLWRGYGRMTVMCTLLMTTSNSAWLLQFCYNIWCPVTDMDNPKCRIRVWTLTNYTFHIATNKMDGETSGKTFTSGANSYVSVSHDFYQATSTYRSTCSAIPSQDAESAIHEHAIPRSEPVGEKTTGTGTSAFDAKGAIGKQFTSKLYV